MSTPNASFSRARLKMVLLSIGGAFMVLFVIFCVFVGLKYLYEYRVSQIGFAQEMTRIRSLPISDILSPRGLSPRRDGVRFEAQ